MSDNSITLDGRSFGGGDPPFIIAELSGNHGQSLDIALALVESAAHSGANAIKLQTYTADTMTLKCDRQDFLIDSPTSLWRGKTLHELYTQAHTPWEWHEPLFQRARELGMIAFSSAFDQSAVDFLINLDVPCIKIASFEINDIPLIRYAASSGKPLIISTGMASIEDIQLALDTVASAGGTTPVLLKCTSHYPADARNANLKTMLDMQTRFGVPVGLSDHTLGIGVSVAAAALGGCVIEKHLVLSRDSATVDAAFSMEPDEFRLLTAECQRACNSIGTIRYGPVEEGVDPYSHRRSIYVAANIRAGEVFSASNLRIVRPGLGLAPRHWEDILGTEAKRDLTLGEPLSWQDIAQ